MTSLQEQRTVGAAPSLLGVNALYVISMILILTLGTALQAWHSGIGLLLTEIGLIWLPAFLFLWRSNLPVDETIRWHWPGVLTAGFAVLAGIGFSFFTIWLAEAASDLFGYTLWLPPRFYPRTFSEGLILFTGLVIAAPLCEEFLFRGVIQRGYERFGVRAAIITVSLMFTAYHLSLQRFILLIPIALVLSYVAFRSASVITSILVHASYNLVAAIILLAGSYQPDINFDPIVSLPVGVVGLLAGGFGVWALARVQGNIGVETDPNSAPLERSESPAKKDFWPLLVAVPVIVLMIVAELIAGLFPGALAAKSLNLHPAPWYQPVGLVYDIHSQTDELLGKAECQINPTADSVELSCQAEAHAEQLEQGESELGSPAFRWAQSAVWDRAQMQLQMLEGQLGTGGETASIRVEQGDGELLVQNEPIGSSMQSREFPANGLINGEWPWRLSALPFEETFSVRSALLQPYLPAGEQADEDAVVIVVQGGEPLATAAGNYMAWRVEIGEQTAWYDVQAPHHLLQYDDGTRVYTLTEITN